MTELTANYETIGDTSTGPVVAVVFGGTYAPESAGNECALQMRHFLRTVVDETAPAAVVLDLLAVDYVWGDAIGSLALPLLDKGQAFRPVAIVATGQTADALRSLLESGSVLRLLPGIRLLGSRPEAVGHLERALALSPVFVRLAKLEQLLRQIATDPVRKPEFKQRSSASGVGSLVSNGILSESFCSRIEALSSARDKLLHGLSAPTEIQVRPIVDELDRLTEVVTAVAQAQSVRPAKKLKPATRTVAGGYFLIRGARPRKNREILPDRVWTPSDAVCTRYPYTWCEADLETPSAKVEEALSDLGLDSKDLTEVRSWVASQVRSGRLGDFGVFLDLASAREFAARFIRRSEEVKLLGIGLPAEFVEAFLNEAVEYYGDLPTCGVFQAVNARNATADGGISLGYEPLGYEPCSIPALVNHISEDWPVRRWARHLNDYGIFSDLETCVRVVDAQVEQAVWSPWLLTDYSIVGGQ
jgi:hypothetical protein